MQKGGKKMKFLKKMKVVTKSIKGNRNDLALYIFENGNKSVFSFLNNNIQSSIRKIYKERIFQGEKEKVLTLFTHGLENFTKLYLTGVGAKDKCNLNDIRLSSAAVAKFARSYRTSQLAVYFDKEIYNLFSPSDVAQAMAEGMILALYRYDKFKKDSLDVYPAELKFYVEKKYQKDAEKGLKIGKIFARATNYAKDLANEPSNYVTAEMLANKAKLLAKSHGLIYKCLDEKDMKKLNMNLLLAVSSASHKPPRLIILKYMGDKKSRKIIGIVGKGITFDSGGISLKRPAGMFHMKRDMTGGAIAMGVIKAVAELKLKLNLVVVIPATENAIGGNSYKPGDIYVSMSGKTVEIFNTDAEGRLVLADAFTYVQRKEKVDILIDIATLTGGVERAIGERAVGFMGNNKELLNEYIESLSATGEAGWPFPLYEDFLPRVTTHFAELKNESGKPPYTISAGLFLKQFVEEDRPWLHLDIAGCDSTNSAWGYVTRGATGISTRSVIELLRRIANK